ncbi:MAG: HAD family hydrolase [Lentisphaerae bacterium]|nr:HAD family hydrolase [Lentisphaerota bacterium]
MPFEPTCTTHALTRFKASHDTLVGIDSDGCVFDTMEIKQKQCFHGLIVEHWELEPIEEHVRAVAEFINLYSRWRGQNRFTALLMTFDLLREHPGARAGGATVPNLPSLRALAGSGVPLGHPALEQVVQETGDREIASVLRWSAQVNRRVAEIASDVPPFAAAQTGLAMIRACSDAICVSQTPKEALLREWQKHDLVQYVDTIAGQEEGTKGEQLARAAGNRYTPRKILVIGDAMGDLDAARAVGACFYPINPRGEEESWKRFCDEMYDLFLAGQYSGECEERLIREFRTLLPESPPWE